jgi:FHA domain
MPNGTSCIRSVSEMACPRARRLTEKEGDDGMMHSAVRPYIMDLGSTNGTYLNNERVEPQRFYELLERVRGAADLWGSGFQF